MSAGGNQPMTPLGRAINTLEETLIALVLGLMTLITFANVVARYVFNSNVLWALEATVFLFAWLVLLGVSHCVKINAHLGVDALVATFSPASRKVVTLLSVALCIVFTCLLLYGSWDYWWAFATKRSFFEVNDVPFPDWLQGLLGLVEDGAPRYDYIPRYIPYFALPLGMALLLFRFVEAGVRVWRGDIELIIASHEAEDAVEEAAARAAREG